LLEYWYARTRSICGRYCGSSKTQTRHAAGLRENTSEGASGIHTCTIKNHVIRHSVSTDSRYPSYSHQNVSSNFIKTLTPRPLSFPNGSEVVIDKRTGSLAQRRKKRYRNYSTTSLTPPVLSSQQSAMDVNVSTLLHGPGGNL